MSLRPQLPRLTPLSPRYSPDDHAGYVEALKAALSKTDLHNIALSGPYGSGKSSVLQGLQNDPEVRGLKPRSVSLATIGPRKLSLGQPNTCASEVETQPEGRDSGAPQATTDEAATVNLVQKEVCKQLLYSSPPRELPMSQYFRPYVPAKLERLAAGVAILIPALLIAGLITRILELSRDLNIALTALILLACLAAGYSMWPRIAGRVLLSEVGTAGAKVSLGGQPTYFDEHLAELKYFFQATKCQLVLFEDLDRFNSLHLVETLRDLNLTLNSDHDTAIRFVYALGDELFPDGESRSKLFDAIVPVVPFASRSTSRGLLSGALQRGETIPEDDMVQFSHVERIIADHTHDHRVLTTINNEFLTYKAMHAPTRAVDMRDSQLLAAMAYKCTHPSDFAKSPALKSSMDILNAEVADDRHLAVGCIRDLRRDLDRADSLLTDARVDAANKLLSAILENAKPLTAGQWAEALQAHQDIQNTHGQRVRIAPSQAVALLSAGQSDLVAAEMQQEDRQAAIREVNNLLDQAQSTSIPDLLEEVLPRVDALRAYYSPDRQPPQWKSPQAYSQLNRLAQALVRAGALDQTFAAYVTLANTAHLSVGGQSFVRTVIDGGRSDHTHPITAEDAVRLLTDRSDDLMSDERGLHVTIADAIFGSQNPEWRAGYRSLLRGVSPELLRGFTHDYLREGTRVGELLDLLQTTPWAVLEALASDAGYVSWLERALQLGIDLDSKAPHDDNTDVQTSSTDAVERKRGIVESISDRARLLPSLTEDAAERLPAVITSLAALEARLADPTFTLTATAALAKSGLVSVRPRGLNLMQTHLAWDGTLSHNALPDAMLSPLLERLHTYLEWAHKMQLTHVSSPPRLSTIKDLGEVASERLAFIVTHKFGWAITWSHLAEVAEAFSLTPVDVKEPLATAPSNLAHAVRLDLVVPRPEVFDHVARDERALRMWAHDVPKEALLLATSTATQSTPFINLAAVHGQTDAVRAIGDDPSLRERLTQANAVQVLEKLVGSDVDPEARIYLAIRGDRPDDIRRILIEAATSLTPEATREALAALDGHYRESLHGNCRWPGLDDRLARELHKRADVQSRKQPRDGGYFVDASGLDGPEN